jgi:DNA-directed RNA polymerase specialized sigma24 family protein
VTAEELEAEFVRLAADGELDKIQRYLRSRRDKVPRGVVREIVQEACLEVVRRQQAGGKITNVAGLVMTISARRLEEAWQKMLDGFEIDAAFARRQQEGGDWRHDEEWQARIERATEYVFKIVASWPADNLRRTLMVIIDAAVEGEQLEARDLDQLLGCARGTGRVWRDRALDRLRAQLEKDGISWDEITGPLPGMEEDDEDGGDVLDMDDDVDQEEM